MNEPQPVQPSTDEAIVKRIQELRQMAIGAVISGDSCYDFAMAARAFFMNYGPVLQSLVSSDVGKQKINRALTMKTLPAEARAFFDRVISAGLAQDCIFVFNDRDNKFVSGLSSLQGFNDLPTNIAILISYIGALRDIYESPEQAKRAAEAGEIH